MNLNFIIFFIFLFIIVLYINNLYTVKRENYNKRYNKIYKRTMYQPTLAVTNPTLTETNPTLAVTNPTLAVTNLTLAVTKPIINKKKITLYYAKWCNHCHPVKAFFNELMKTNSDNISYHTIENDEFKNIPNIYNKIEGFPTILIECNGQEIKYTGNRNKESLILFVNNL